MFAFMFTNYSPDTPLRDKVLLLDTPEKITQFNNYYALDAYSDRVYIDWPLVSQYYAGVEVRGLEKFKETPGYIKYMWLIGLDIDSGCVWNIEAIKNFEEYYTPSCTME
jgi:hypothetical protein